MMSAGHECIAELATTAAQTRVCGVAACPPLALTPPPRCGPCGPPCSALSRTWPHRGRSRSSAGVTLGIQGLHRLAATAHGAVPDVRHKRIRCQCMSTFGMVNVVSSPAASSLIDIKASMHDHELAHDQPCMQPALTSMAPKDIDGTGSPSVPTLCHRALGACACGRGHAPQAGVEQAHGPSVMMAAVYLSQALPSCQR